MTQILIPSTNVLRTPEAREAIASLMVALTRAENMVTTGGGTSPISGQTYQRFGGLVRFTTERLVTDGRGPSWATVIDTYTLPEHATTVLFRMLDEGREIFKIEGTFAALGGTTTR